MGFLSSDSSHFVQGANIQAENFEFVEVRISEIFLIKSEF